MNDAMMQKLQAMFGGGGLPDPDIPANYDPDKIRDNTEPTKRQSDLGRKYMVAGVLPFLLGMGLTGIVFDLVWLEQIAATALLGLLIFNIALNVMGFQYVRSNEQKGSFVSVAHLVFRADSPYWTYRKIEVMDWTPLSRDLTFILMLICGPFLLQWYGVMTVAILSTLADLIVAEVFNRKGKGLVEYKRRWDEFQAKKQEEAAAAKRKHDDMIRDVLGDGDGEQFDILVTQDKRDFPEANALSAEGPVHIPEDLQGQEVIEPKDAERIVPVRYPNDHADVKYEGDDEGDSHLRGG